MENNKKKHLILIVSCCIFVVGTCALYMKVNPTLRFPAAVPGMTYDDLGQTNARQILESTDIRLDNEVYTIALGNNGNLCQKYQSLRLTFITPNMRVSGDTPSLTLETNCQSNQSGVVSIQVPFKQIMQEKPGDIDVVLRQPASMQFQARNVIGFWPEYWVLTKVEFYNEGSEASLVMNEKEVSRWTQNRISMKWN